MTSLAQSERGALCDLALELGPDVPTLCTGWTTFDLVTHLIARERHPIAGLGIILSPLAGMTEKAMAKEKRRDYEQAVERLRSGPPYPMRLVDRQINTIEYFVHLEDIRRANARTESRPDADGADDELWNTLRRGARIIGRKARSVALDLVRDTGETIKVSGGDGKPSVRIVGRPGEIALFLMGRKEAAHVELEGDDEAIQFLHQADLSA
jgi:uncharacterized protein (TIGR03085 family)